MWKPKHVVQIMKRNAGHVDTKAADRNRNASSTVRRALALFDLVVAEPRGLGLTELARRAKLNKTTAFRMLGALEEAGLIVRDGRAGLYRPGLKLLRVAEQVLQSLDFRTVAHRHVEKLALEVGHGVLSGVLEGAEVVYVDVVNGSEGLRVHQPIGGRKPLHYSAIGKAILAYLPPQEASEILAGCRFEPRTPLTITDRGTFVAHLAEVRRQGWALVRDEDIPGVSSFAAPVFDHTGRPVGSIGVAGPSFLLEGSTLKRYVDLLLDACRAASGELGYGESPVEVVAAGGL